MLRWRQHVNGSKGHDMLTEVEAKEMCGLDNGSKEGLGMANLGQVGSNLFLFEAFIGFNNICNFVESDKFLL